MSGWQHDGGYEQSEKDTVYHRHHLPEVTPAGDYPEAPRRWVEGLYRRWGRLVWNHWSCVLTFSLLVLVGLSCGLLRVFSLTEGDPSKAFLPHGDPVKAAKDLNEELFVRQITELYMVEPRTDDGDALSAASMRALLAINDAIWAINVWDGPSNRTWALKDMCLFGSGSPESVGPGFPDQGTDKGCTNYSVINVFFCNKSAPGLAPYCKFDDPQVRADFLKMDTAAIRAKVMAAQADDALKLGRLPPLGTPPQMNLDFGSRAGGPSKALKNWINLDDTNLRRDNYTATYGHDGWHDVLQRWEDEFVKLLKKDGGHHWANITVHPFGQNYLMKDVFTDIGVDIPGQIAINILLLVIPYALLLPKLTNSHRMHHFVMGQVAYWGTFLGVTAAYGACCLVGLTFSGNYACTMFALFLLGLHHALLFGFRMHQRIGEVNPAPADADDDDDDAQSAVTAVVSNKGWEDAFVLAVSDVGATMFIVVASCFCGYLAVAVYPDQPPAYRFLMWMLALGPLLQHVSILGVMAPIAAWNLRYQVGRQEGQTVMLREGIIPLRYLMSRFMWFFFRPGLCTSFVGLLTIGLIAAAGVLGTEAIGNWHDTHYNGQRSDLFAHDNDMHQYFKLDEHHFGDYTPIPLFIMSKPGLNMKDPVVAAKYLRFYDKLAGNEWVDTRYGDPITFSWYHNFIDFVRTAHTWECQNMKGTHITKECYGPERLVDVNGVAIGANFTAAQLAAAFPPEHDLRGFDCFFNAWFAYATGPGATLWVSADPDPMMKMLAGIACMLEALLVRSPPASKFTDGGPRVAAAGGPYIHGAPYGYVNTYMEHGVSSPVGQPNITNRTIMDKIRYDVNKPMMQMTYNVPLNKLGDWLAATEAMRTFVAQHAEPPLDAHIVLDNDAFVDFRAFKILEDWSLRTLWLTTLVASVIAVCFRPWPTVALQLPAAIAMYIVVIVGFMHYQHLQFDIITVGWVPALPLFAIDTVLPLMWPRKRSTVVDAGGAAFVAALMLCILSIVLIIADHSPIDTKTAKLMAFCAFWEAAIVFLWILPFRFAMRHTASTFVDPADPFGDGCDAEGVPLVQPDFALSAAEGATPQCTPSAPLPQCTPSASIPSVPIKPEHNSKVVNKTSP